MISLVPSRGYLYMLFLVQVYANIWSTRLYPPDASFRALIYLGSLSSRLLRLSTTRLLLLLP